MTILTTERLTLRHFKLSDALWLATRRPAEGGTP